MRAPAVLGNRDFRWYFAAVSVSALGSSMSGLAVTFALLGLGASATELGVVLASGTVPALLLMLVGGVAGDRWDRRAILVVSDVVMMLSVGALALLLATGRAEIWHFVVAEVVGGAAMAFTGPAAVGLMPSLVPEDLLQQANSLRSTTRNVAAIAGPSLAGVLVAAGTPAWALAADAASFAVSAVLLVRLPASRGEVQAGASVWGDVRHGWQAFTSRRWVVLMVGSFAVYQATVLPAVFVLGPILAERELDGAASWAAILSGRSAGALVAGLVLLRWRPRRPLVASSLLVLLDVPFLAALAGGLPIVVVVLTGALSWAGVMAADTVWESTLQAGVPRDVLSRVSSYDWFGSIMVNPLGFALIGSVSGALGVTPVLVGAVVLSVVVHVGLVATPAIRGVRRPEAVPVG